MTSQRREPPTPLTPCVVEAVRHDRPEVIETGAPVRAMLAMAQIAPRLAERVVERLGGTEAFRRVAESRGRID